MKSRSAPLRSSLAELEKGHERVTRAISQARATTAEWNSRAPARLPRIRRELKDRIRRLKAVKRRLPWHGFRSHLHLVFFRAREGVLLFSFHYLRLALGVTAEAIVTFRWYLLWLTMTILATIYRSEILLWLQAIRDAIAP